MKCKIICDLLPMYIDDVCSDETRESVEQHLATCPDCRKEYEKMKTEITMNKVEDMDEKELMERGKETMTEHVKEKLYRKMIFGDTILNLLLAICLFTNGMGGMIKGGNEDAYVEISIVGASLWALLGADIIYWLIYFVKRGTEGSVIVDTICKWSIWLKVVLLICAVAGAAVVGFYVMLNGGKI